MPSDKNSYNRLTSGILHVDNTGIWEESQTITFPRLSNTRWAQIYRWMADNALVEQYLNQSYWEEPNPDINELSSKQ